VPKKVRRLALKMALSGKLKENSLTVLDQLEMERIKTKDFIEIMRGLKMDNVLIVTDARDEILEKSSRNVPDVKILRTEGLNVYDLLKYRNLVLLASSVKGIEGRLAV
jgi:large subunit ribosomal protein L4